MHLNPLLKNEILRFHVAILKLQKLKFVKNPVIKCLLVSLLFSSIACVETMEHTPKQHDNPKIDKQVYHHLLADFRSEYLKCLKKGNSKLENLHDRIENPTDLLKNLSEKNRINNQKFRSDYETSYNFFPTPHSRAELEQEGYHIESTNISDPYNFHFNFFDTEGNVYCLSNYKSKKVESLNNSAVIWNQLQFLKDKQYIYHKINKINAISIRNLQSLKVAFHAIYEKDKASSLDYTFSIDSDEAKALLGSCCGNTAYWLVYDHYQDLGFKTLGEIKLFNLVFQKVGILKSFDACIKIE